MGGSFGFGRGFFSTDSSGDDGADDLFKWGAVVGGDPFCKLEEWGGDERFWIDEIGEVAQGKVRFGSWPGSEDGAGSGAVTERNANAAAGEDVEVFRNGVVEDELGRAVDEDAGGVWHAGRLTVRGELGTFFSGLVF